MEKSRGSKKLTKLTKMFLFLTMCILTAVILSAAVSADATPKVGDVVGNVLYSDITAYINGQAIPTSVIQGQTLVVVEDLARYGFDVVWNQSAKTLRVELNTSKKFNPLVVIKDTVNKPGTFKQQYYYTDIKTYISGNQVPSYAINGQTLMNFELLAIYGKLDWNAQLKEIRLQTTPKVGDVLGNVLYSDITAYINGQAIPTSVINGKTLVTVEDLARYGFDVAWSQTDKTLKVELNKSKQFNPLEVSANTGSVGSVKGQYLYTDIKTYLSGIVVESYAVGGKTMMDFELLKKYGKLDWNSQTKTLSLTVENNAIDVLSISANGSATTPTTQLTITLNRALPGLSAADFTVSGATKGSLTGSGPVYYLGISNITAKNGENIAVYISKKDFTFKPSSLNVTVYNPGYQLISLTGNGSPNYNYGYGSASYGSTTTQLTLTFDRAVPNLSVSDITVTGATKGYLSGLGPVYYLTLTDIQVASGQYITVSFYKPGYLFTPSSQQVVVYRQPVSFTATANGSDSASTTYLTLSFDRSVAGLSANDITIQGATKGTLGQTTANPNVYILNISNIQVSDRQYITVQINKSGYEFNPPSTTVMVRTLPNVLISSVTANGGYATSVTTQLTITLDRQIPGLSSSDIIIDVPSARSTTAISKGTLSNNAATNQYVLPITFNPVSTNNPNPIRDGDQITVRIAKTGYNFTPTEGRTITVYNPAVITINYTVSQNGSFNGVPTTQLTITFDRVLPSPGLTDANINITSGISEKGFLSPTGSSSVYTLPIKPSSTSAQSTVIMNILNYNFPGYNFNPLSGSNAIVVYSSSSSSVSSITGVPTSVAVGSSVSLSGTVNPSTAANQTILWSISSTGTTGATLNGNILSTTAEGTVVITATIINGISTGINYTQNFVITSSASSVTVNKTALLSAISAAYAARSSAVINTDAANVPAGTLWVTQSAFDALSSAIFSAEAVNNSSSATQADVNSAAASLNGAVNAFNASKQYGTKV